ncbi:hypothetical protein [Desulfonema magnum]|uniref:Uncharacterized protein n=1 Tax=Desulfonema magnum TaxID=45655 RepID=A0A975GN37_9BACT|nr:hypothetical protein [Desulfonema magnum]QTA87327.1 Uncharacterized protein dnm_033570 [Desulfonema magnum]
MATTKKRSDRYRRDSAEVSPVETPVTNPGGVPRHFKRNDNSPKQMRVLFAIVLAVLLSACVRFGGHSPDKEVYDYLETANHLNEAQKQEMMQGNPFIGMTMKEAHLAMYPDRSAAVRFSDRTLQHDYRGGWGVRYSLFFDGGTPNRVENYFFLSDKEIEEFRKPRDFRPDFVFDGWRNRW